MFITVSELCTLMGVTRTTVTNWRNEGMPFKKFGKLVRLDKEEVMEWLRTKK